MARPKKQSVDYFPHYCDHGKTVYILENMYQNDGYAFLYKLMERLGKTEGHVIDCRNPADWEFLQAKTHVTEEMAERMLEKLALLGVIDADLWKERIIWMQSFVDSIADVYRNRRVEIPLRPGFYNEKPREDAISTDENPQRKKVKKESIENNISTDEKPIRANGKRSAQDAVAEIKRLIKFKEWDPQKSIHYLCFNREHMIDDPIRDQVLREDPCPNDNYQRQQWFGRFEQRYTELSEEEAAR